MVGGREADGIAKCGHTHGVARFARKLRSVPWA
jgi:hypothetical protein